MAVLLGLNGWVQRPQSNRPGSASVISVAGRVDGDYGPLLMGDVSWSDVETFMTVAGFGVSVIGLPIGIWQLVRTANAATATKLAVEANSRTHALSLIGQIRVYEAELDHAIEQDSRVLASRSLANLSNLLSEMSGVADNISLANAEGLAAMRAAARTASAAKRDLYTKKNRTIPQITTPTSKALEEVVIVISNISATLVNQIPKTAN